MDDSEKLIRCSSCGDDFKPEKIIAGLAKCPYCGYLNSMDKYNPPKKKPLKRKLKETVPKEMKESEVEEIPPPPSD